MSAALPAWWAPRVRATVDGEPWASDRIAAFRGLSCDGGDVKDASEDMPQLLATPATRTVSEERRSRGYAVMGGRFFRAHYIDLASRLFPEIAWRDDATDTGAMLGIVNDRTVALLMPLRPGSFEEATVEPGYPRCSTCNGSGRAGACKGCDGGGHIECPCCATEIACRACAGSCPTCKGSKYDMPAAEAVQP